MSLDCHIPIRLLYTFLPDFCLSLFQYALKPLPNTLLSVNAYWLAILSSRFGAITFNVSCFQAFQTLCRAHLNPQVFDTYVL